MHTRSIDFIGSTRLYLKVIYHNASYLFAARPMLRLLAIWQRHQFRSIGRTRIIGDRAFIGYCEEFSRRLQKEDSDMFNNLFIKNKFIFIQYSDHKFKNIMFGEYAVPAHYQKFKAYGVGALMIYGFYCTELFGRTVGAHVHRVRQPGYSRIPIEKTFMWLTKHHFPDAIVKWFGPKNEATNAGGISG